MGLPPLRHEPPPDGLGPPRGDGATRPGRREPLGKEIGRRTSTRRLDRTLPVRGQLPYAPRREAWHRIAIPGLSASREISTGDGPHTRRSAKGRHLITGSPARGGGAAGAGPLGGSPAAAP